MCIRICAWCKRVLGHVEPYDNNKPTHTICKACNKEYFPTHEGGDECTITDSPIET